MFFWKGSNKGFYVIFSKVMYFYAPNLTRYKSIIYELAYKTKRRKRQEFSSICLSSLTLRPRDQSGHKTWTGNDLCIFNLQNETMAKRIQFDVYSTRTEGQRFFSTSIWNQCHITPSLDPPPHKWSLHLGKKLQRSKCEFKPRK